MGDSTTKVDYPVGPYSGRRLLNGYVARATGGTRHTELPLQSAAWVICVKTTIDRAVDSSIRTYRRRKECPSLPFYRSIRVNGETVNVGRPVRRYSRRREPPTY